MEDLSQTTFLICTHLDSAQRARNLKTKILTLLGEAKTTIFLIEHDHSPRIPAVLNEIPPDLRAQIHHHFVPAIEGAILFYRTKLINEIFTDILTPVVCISSIDTLCPIPSYLTSQLLALEDLPNYPYSYGYNREEVNYWGEEILEATNNLDYIAHPYYKSSGLNVENYPELFINRKQWLQIGLENENLIFCQAENTERALRIEAILGEPPRWRPEEHELPLFTLCHPPSPLTSPFSERNKMQLAMIQEYYNKAQTEDAVPFANLPSEDGLPPMDLSELKEYYIRTSRYLHRYGFNL